MEIFKTIFFGKQNTFYLHGIKIIFTKKDSPYLHKFATNNLLLSCLSTTTKNLLTNYTFKIITFSYLHTFVHEVAHALALKALGVKNICIEINSNTALGHTGIAGKTKLSSWSLTLVDLAGPLANVIFSVSLVYGSYIFSPIISLPFSLFLGAGGTIWICGEYYYALSSLIGDRGDWANIASRGKLSLLLASAALITPCALAILSI
jgi:hypothetical protein